jgi:glycosyltransferase involved in cell wall biosynthesis
MRPKILFIVPYPFNKAPSQRLKFEQYYPAMREQGYELELAPFMSETLWRIAYVPGKTVMKILLTLVAYLRRMALLLRLPFCDIVYVHLFVTPFGPPFFEYLVRKLSRKVIYDIDDLVFLGKSSDANAAIRFLKGASKPVFLIRHADHVITCTPYLDAFARKHNLRTTDISSTIDTARYTLADTCRNNQDVVLGWSGSHSTSKYLGLLARALLQLRRLTPFKLKVMGDAGFRLPGIEVEAIAWSEEAELPFLRSLDIGLYPLPLDEEWVNGKSGLKALQYMAVGLPVVASDAGCTSRVVAHGKTGYLVKTMDEWTAALLELIGNPLLRRSMGEQGRRIVEESYSVNANKQLYLDILAGV